MTAQRRLVRVLLLVNVAVWGAALLQVARAQSPVVTPPPACWCPTDGAPFVVWILLAFLAIVGAGCLAVGTFDAGARRGWWPA